MERVVEETFGMNAKISTTWTSGMHVVCRHVCWQNTYTHTHNTKNNKLKSLEISLPKD